MPLTATFIGSHASTANLTTYGNATERAPFFIHRP